MIIFIHQYIIWFQIAMDHAFRVSIIQPFADQIEETNGFLVTQTFWCPFNLIHQSSTSHVCHDDIDQITMFSKVIDWDDLRVLEVRNDLYFLSKPLYKADVILQRRRHNL